jgi:hypothetical protein
LHIVIAADADAHANPGFPGFRRGAGIGIGG